MKQRQSDINLNVLRALQSRGVCNLEEITEYHGFLVLKPSREEFVRAVIDLNTLGYIEQPIPGDNEYYKLTDKGVNQLNRTARLDPAIWGRAAAQ
jgi:DNA-binding transcriptional regulator PaaX